MTTYACDFESSYINKVRDIKSLGVVGYLRHPATDIYLVSIVGDDGYKFVGHPKDAPWEAIAGHRWVSHNRSFDLACHSELQRRGIIPVCDPAEWHCTADMAAFLQAPRSLKDASRELLGIEISKAQRDAMAGRTYQELSAVDRAALDEYALKDSELCLQLWLQEGHKWPAHERDYSFATTIMCNRGVGIDLNLVAAGVTRMEEVITEASTRIPWAGKLNLKGKEIPLTSPKELKAECERRGIPAPTTTDAKSEAWQAWLDQYEEQADFIKAIQKHRRANRILTILEAMQRRAVGDTLPYGLKYGGATPTLRWAGDTGLNMQNLPRAPFEGVDLRACIVPREGKTFVVSDYAQVEARITQWLAGNTKLLEMLKNGFPIYEAYARMNLGYSDPRPLKKVDPTLYLYSKGAVLGMGFGMSGEKYQTFAKTALGISMSIAEAEKAVDDFRRNNPGIVKLWRKLDRGIKASAGSRHNVVELPSGRRMHYFDLASIDGEWSCRVERGGHRTRIWGSKQTENLAQATARELLADAAVRLEEAGIPVVMHVHDEVIAEVDKDSAKEALHEVERIMREAPPWSEGLPVEVEAHIMERYGK